MGKDGDKQQQQVVYRQRNTNEGANSESGSLERLLSTGNVDGKAT